MLNPTAADIRAATTWSIVLSALMLVLGVLAVAVPLIAGVAVIAVVGWLLVFSGFLHVGFAWRGGRASSVVWEVLLGILYAAVGFYLILRPLVGVASLALAIAVYLVTEGVLECVLSFRLRPAPGSGWLFLDGVVTLILAAMIWSTWPSSATWVVGTLIGISMFFSGISRLMLSLAIRRALA
jgi:uncharacterized membrane protein HdeD (DUF308 family)